MKCDNCTNKDLYLEIKNDNEAVLNCCLSRDCFVMIKKTFNKHELNQMIMNIDSLVKISGV